ncbi:hypothetical protein FQZ97_1030040 [compost metagenome]
MHVERTITAPVFIGAALVSLHLLEVRKTVAVRPGRQTERGPVIEVQRVAANEHHPVDGGGSPQHTTTVLIASIAVETGLRLALEAPVELGAFQRKTQSCRHVQDHAVVARTRLEEQHGRLTVRTQAIRHYATSGAGSDDDVIVLVLAHDRASRHFSCIQMVLTSVY